MPAQPADMTARASLPAGQDSLEGHLVRESVAQRPRRARWRRLVRLVSELSYDPGRLVSRRANVLLRTRLLRNVVSGSSLSFAISGTLHGSGLDYAERVLDLLPGRVHVEGLTIRGRDQNRRMAL